MLGLCEDDQGMHTMKHISDKARLPSSAAAHTGRLTHVQRSMLQHAGPHSVVDVHKQILGEG